MSAARRRSGAATRDGPCERRTRWTSAALTGTEGVGEVGPGWEYYLDALVASRDGQPAPDFDDYYPAMKEHFEAQR